MRDLAIYNWRLTIDYCPVVHLKKQSQFAGYWPEILNKKAIRQSVILQNKANLFRSARCGLRPA